MSGTDATSRRQTSLPAIVGHLWHWATNDPRQGHADPAAIGARLSFYCSARLDSPAGEEEGPA